MLASSRFTRGLCLRLCSCLRRTCKPAFRELLQFGDADVDRQCTLRWRRTQHMLPQLLLWLRWLSLSIHAHGTWNNGDIFVFSNGLLRTNFQTQAWVKPLEHCGICIIVRWLLNLKMHYFSSDPLDMLSLFALLDNFLEFAESGRSILVRKWPTTHVQWLWELWLRVAMQAHRRYISSNDKHWNRSHCFCVACVVAWRSSGSLLLWNHLSVAFHWSVTEFQCGISISVRWIYNVDRSIL